MGPGRRGEEWDVAAGYDQASRRVRLKGLARRNGGWRNLCSPWWALPLPLPFLLFAP
jgi:hypothetical protein